MANIETKVAGTTFEKRQNTLMGMRKLIDKGEKVSIVLVREPGNEKDPNAVKVLTRWKKGDQTRRAQIGYLPKETAAIVAPLMDNKTFVRVHSFDITKTKIVGVKLELAY